jgi:hypothetical protein
MYLLAFGLETSSWEGTCHQTTRRGLAGFLAKISRQKPQSVTGADNETTSTVAQ